MPEPFTASRSVVMMRHSERNRPAAPLEIPTTEDRSRDPRYGTQRWRKVARMVLARDRWECLIAPGCPERATVADHIEAAYPGMPDELFFALNNLRAACRDHNILRGKAARLERETRQTKPAAITGDYS